MRIKMRLIIVEQLLDISQMKILSRIHLFLKDTQKLFFFQMLIKLQIKMVDQ